MTSCFACYTICFVDSFLLDCIKSNRCDRRRTIVEHRSLVRLYSCPCKRGKVKCSSTFDENIPQPEDYDNISRNQNFVIPHEAFSWKGDLGEWTRAWEDHNFHPDNDGPLPPHLKGPSDNYTRPVDLEEFLANLSTFEPCEEDFVSYGDIYEPMDPEAIQRYRKLGQDNGACAVENMSDWLSPFRLLANDNEATKQQYDTRELPDYRKLLEVLSRRTFHGWKRVFNAEGSVLLTYSCSFSVQCDSEDANYAFDIRCSTLQVGQDSFQRVPLESLVLSPHLNSFSWIDSKDDQKTLSLFFGFLDESLTIVELEYDKNYVRLYIFSFNSFIFFL